ncbi:Lsr2 family protein (plasmid) [Rhodococcus sp. USK10]|uniref:Lsr2 family DNA-binding protein n=1 Tax=Rhodococcus sp. USK10 TaxID=2789739 RepID=UPI001C5F02F5|nr:histone-like nucleoid-structuring protein Lsr2 [Rhodococcus sp. USK10]QYA99888.1 Lsr2 family protein [Rhodococcus sp. USK10]
MKTSGQVVVALGAGYLLGRGTATLTSSPEVAKLCETVRGELMTSAKAAAITAVTSHIDSLTSRLHSGGESPAGHVGTGAGALGRSGDIRRLHLVEPDEGETKDREGERSAENEQGRTDGNRAGKGKGEPGKETDETDESPATEQPEQEQRPRQRPRRNRSTSTAKEIRQWAVQHGYEISSRGRIPADIEHAFADAH